MVEPQCNSAPVYFPLVTYIGIFKACGTQTVSAQSLVCHPTLLMTYPNPLALAGLYLQSVDWDGPLWEVAQEARAAQEALLGLTRL